MFRGLKAHDNMTMSMCTMVWDQMAKLVCAPQVISPHAPLWGNPRLPHLCSIPDPSMWARFGITKIQHVMPEGSLLPYNTLKALFHLPSRMFFRYLQLRHAIHSQFPQVPNFTFHIVESFLTSSHVDKIQNFNIRHTTGSNATGRCTPRFPFCSLPWEL